MKRIALLKLREMHMYFLVKPSNSLKKKLLIKSYWDDFDEEMNMMFLLAEVITENWSTTSASTMDKVLENPNISLQDLAKHLQISQSSVSARYKRACLNEIQRPGYTPVLVWSIGGVVHSSRLINLK